MFVEVDEERRRGHEVRLAELCGVLNATSAALVAEVAAVVEDGSWAGPGIRSVEHWVAWQCGLSAARASALVAAARRRSELPVTMAAFEEGRLSSDQVAVVVRHTPAAADASVAALAEAATVAQLSRTLSDYPFGSPNGEPAPEAPAPERRWCSFADRDDGTWGLSARLAADEGAALAKALEAARDELFEAAEASGEDVAGRERIGWADALCRLGSSYLGGGPEADRPLAERHSVLVHLRADDLAAHVHLGPALPAWARRLHTCDATWRYVLEDDAGVPIKLGRARRDVPGPLRRLVEERDRGCRVPGCGARRWLHVHHLVHVEDQGPTEPANLACLCRFHHRAHHRGELAIEGDPEQPDGLTFRDPRTGRALGPAGRPVAPAAPPEQAAADLGVRSEGYRHPSGEQLQRRWVHLPEVLAERDRE